VPDVKAVKKQQREDAAQGGYKHYLFFNFHISIPGSFYFIAAKGTNSLNIKNNSIQISFNCSNLTAQKQFKTVFIFTPMRNAADGQKEALTPLFGMNVKNTKNY
jgi:hypothetical protein